MLIENEIIFIKIVIRKSRLTDDVKKSTSPTRKTTCLGLKSSQSNKKALLNIIRKNDITTKKKYERKKKHHALSKDCEMYLNNFFFHLNNF